MRRAQFWLFDRRRYDQTSRLRDERTPQCTSRDLQAPHPLSADRPVRPRVPFRDPSSGSGSAMRWSREEMEGPYSEWPQASYGISRRPTRPENDATGQRDRLGLAPQTPYVPRPRERLCTVLRDVTRHSGIPTSALAPAPAASFRLPHQRRPRAPPGHWSLPCSARIFAWRISPVVRPVRASETVRNSAAICAGARQHAIPGCLAGSPEHLVIL